jgi:hypothetical protein
LEKDNMNALIKCLAIASLIGAGFVAYDQTQDAKDNMQDAAMPQPTEEHKWLAEGAGKWKAVGKIWMEGQEMPISGIQTNTMQQGGFWQLIDFKSDDGNFAGNGVCGYDTIKKKFVSVWVDSMTPEFSPAEGTRSADKKTLTMQFTSTHPKHGPQKITETITRKDDKTVHFEMNVAGPDGKPQKIMDMTYTRM